MTDLTRLLVLSGVLWLLACLTGCQQYERQYSVSYQDQAGRSYGASVALKPVAGYAK